MMVYFSLVVMLFMFFFYHFNQTNIAKLQAPKRAEVRFTQLCAFITFLFLLIHVFFSLSLYCFYGLLVGLLCTLLLHKR